MFAWLIIANIYGFSFFIAGSVLITHELFTADNVERGSDISVSLHKERFQLAPVIYITNAKRKTEQALKGPFFPSTQWCSTSVFLRNADQRFNPLFTAAC